MDRKGSFASDRSSWWVVGLIGRERIVGGKGFVDRWGVLVGLVRLYLMDWFGGRVFAEVIGSLSNFSSDELLVD